MIQDILQKPFGELDRLALVNAIYFKGQWTQPFDSEMNTQMDFNGSDKTTKDAEMMTNTMDVRGYAGMIISLYSCHMVIMKRCLWR